MKMIVVQPEKYIAKQNFWVKLTKIENFSK